MKHTLFVCTVLSSLLLACCARMPVGDPLPEPIHLLGHWQEINIEADTSKLFVSYGFYPDGTFLILSDMDSLKVTPVFLDSIKSLSQTHLRATYLLDSTSLVITHPLFNDTSEVWIINEVQPNYAVPVVKGDLLLRLQRNDTTQTQHLRHLRRFPTTSDSLKKMDCPH